MKTEARLTKSNIQKESGPGNIGHQMETNTRLTGTD